MSDLWNYIQIRGSYGIFSVLIFGWPRALQIPFIKFTLEWDRICLGWNCRRLSIVPLISVHQKALVGNWCRIYGIIFKLEGVMEFSLCSYLDGRGHFKAHSSNSRRNGTERRDLGLLHVYVHWLTSMYPHNVFMVVEFSVWMPKIEIDNLQNNTQGHLVDGTIVSLTKHVMF